MSPVPNLESSGISEMSIFTIDNFSKLYLRSNKFEGTFGVDIIIVSILLFSLTTTSLQSVLGFMFRNLQFIPIVRLCWILFKVS